jgi:putative aldouronate transport system permease protein
MSRIRESFIRKVFNTVNIVLLLTLTVLCLVPFVNVLALSFSSPDFISAGLVYFVPKGLSFDFYAFLFRRTAYWQAFLISIIRVITGTLLNLFMVLLTAYPLSKESSYFHGRTAYAWYFFITMLVSGGMIPSYLLVTGLGLRNTLWALIFPGALPVFNLVLMINFFRQIPKDLEEASLIDGASHFRTLAQIYVPCSMAAIATISLFCMVGHWNEWFDGMLYINKPELKPLQTYLRSVIINLDITQISGTDYEVYKILANRGLKCAQIIIAVIPILCAYPFLQRYFVKGIVLGSVKE